MSFQELKNDVPRLLFYVCDECNVKIPYRNCWHPNCDTGNADEGISLPYDFEIFTQEYKQYKALGLSSRLKRMPAGSFLQQLLDEL